MYLQGQPREKFQRMTSTWFSSLRMIEPSARCTSPSIAFLIQFQNSTSPVAPRLAVMFVCVRRPGILRTVSASLPLRYSIGLISTSRPPISVNEPLTAEPSALTPLTMIWKL